MKCPYCGTDDTKVIDSRPAEENNAIRRGSNSNQKRKHKRAI